MPVETFEIVRRGPYAEGKSFGAAGVYEMIEGVLHYAVNSNDTANTRIVDLALAPRGADGLVRFRGALVMLRPFDAARANGTLLVDVPNRGRLRALSAFNLQSPVKALTDPTHPGDGLLFRRGFALSSVGWQFDVDPALGLWLDAPRAEMHGKPLRGEVICQLRADRATNTLHIGQLGAAPYAPAELDQHEARLYRTDERTREHTLISRDAWQCAKQTKTGVEPNGEHVYMPAGFDAGQLYTLVFVAEGAPVVGCGLLAIRDAAIWLRQSELSSHDRVLAFGVSQTGRLLRQFMYEGMNANGVFDGLLVHIAGGQRGDFNHRFAQPSAAGAPSFGQQFPFLAQRVRDPLSGREAGLLDRNAAAALPKVMFTNTSWEYWRGDAGLIHIDADGADVVEDPNTRIYQFSGTQHIGGVFPPTNIIPELPVRARYPFSIVDHSALVRAALLNLDAWVRGEVVPPASRHPRVVDGTAKTRAAVLAAFPALPDLVPVDASVLSTIRVLDLAPGTQQVTYPVNEGAAYPAMVAALDSDGNELGGIRMPAVAVPLGTHTGWNPRHPDTGAPEQAEIFVGFTNFFPRNDVERALRNDPRPSIAARYADRADYLQRVGVVADQLISSAYVLAEDREMIIRQCGAHYDFATRGNLEPNASA